MNPEEIFEQFVDRYCEKGDASIPLEWPEDLRRKCLFFVKFLESRGEAVGCGQAASGEQSVASILERSGVSARLSLPGADEPPSFAPSADAERYVIERELARGGMGRILLAYDRDFRRRIAVKVLLGAADDVRRTSRFVEEAQATAQLEHPNIGPVYDMGLEPSGAPFFTMKWIRGRNLKEVLASRAPDVSLIRLVQIVQQAAMGVHFANTRGVVHRDLKPQNVMVGDFGEVLVVDWGLAKILRPGGPLERGPAGVGAGGSAPVSTARADEDQPTLEGAVQGSPAYMAPEQARGEMAEIDARTDVFGLGAILYEVLTGSPPYPDSSVQAALGKARRGEVVPPGKRARGRSIPPALDEACRKALAARKEDRFQSARELHDALQRFVEGIHDAERRAAEVERLCRVASGLREELRGAEERESDLRRREGVLRGTLAGDDPEEAKQPLWDLSARASAAREEASAAFNRTTAAYMAVLSIDPGDAQARAALSEIYYARLVAAEERGDREAASLYEGLVSQYDAGRFRVELEGEGTLRLTSDPPGAAVLLSRHDEKGPLLVETPPENVGDTPLEMRLARGSYLARLWKPGFCGVCYPFLLRRCGAHEARVRLSPEGSIPDGFVQVPGGETIVGGDEGSFPALPRAVVRVGDIFAGRFPVTLGEYCAFLDDRLADGDPGIEDLVPFFGAEKYVVRDPVSGFAPIPRLDPRVPVIAIPVEAPHAYCAWLSRKLGKKVRLLEEVEWERCARGGDGRIYPWGNGFDWAFCKGRPSRKGEAFPEPVGAFPRDESPFGVRDLAGGVRELCAGGYGEGYRPLRGGSWYNPFPFVFRADCRTSRGEGTRTTDAGFRVCYDGTG